MYDINSYESVRDFRKKIPLSEDLMTNDYLIASLEKVITDLYSVSLNEKFNGKILHELLRALYVLSFHNSNDFASRIVSSYKEKLNIYEILRVILTRNTHHITIIYSILSNLTGGSICTSEYLDEIEQNNKFFISFSFEFLKTFDYMKDLNDTIEHIDKLIGFLFVNHRLYIIDFDDFSSNILMHCKTFIETTLMTKFKHKKNHFEYMRMNILSILFDHLNKRRMNPDYIADYIIILIDMIKKIVSESKKNSKQSDETVFYSFYQINDTKTFVYCLDVLERLYNCIEIIQVDMLKEIIYEQNVLVDIFKILSEGNKLEISMCCRLLLLLIANENIKSYLSKNKNKINVKKENLVKQFKHLLSIL